MKVALVMRFLELVIVTNIDAGLACFAESSIQSHGPIRCAKTTGTPNEKLLHPNQRSGSTVASRLAAN